MSWRCYVSSPQGIRVRILQAAASRTEVSLATVRLYDGSERLALSPFNQPAEDELSAQLLTVVFESKSVDKREHYNIDLEV